VVRQYDLTLGLPHTNRRGLWEPLLLMHAGHFQWASISSAIGRPLSELRTVSGGEVYAAFYYIEESIPARAPVESFGLDQTVRFSVALRAFKNIAVEGLVRFDLPERLGEDSPVIRFGNIFITPVQGNSELRVAPPANADFTSIPPLPNRENPYHLTREAASTGSLGLVLDTWPPIGDAFDFEYRIDVDRDTNGAGLVYFANYITFMETAEREMLDSGTRPPHARSLRRRRTAYYGNADPRDTVRVRVSAFADSAHPGQVGHRYTIERQKDGQLICLSEAIKVLVEDS
jgi:probable biosynthetic protein (TIGR04098 family)